MRRRRDSKRRESNDEKRDEGEFFAKAKKNETRAQVEKSSIARELARVGEGGEHSQSLESETS